MTRVVFAFLLSCSVAVAADSSTDRSVHAQGKTSTESLLRAEAPYIAKARATYRAAKKRYLAGLPRGDRFTVRYRLREPGTHRSEGIIVEVAAIKGSEIYGHIASEASLIGARPGQPVRFSESEIEDWSIVHPDGRQEGNFLGKFLSELQRQKT